MKPLRAAAACSFVLALGALRCGGVRSVEPPPPEAAAATVPSLARGPLVDGPLAFPPAEEGRRGRAELPPARGGDHTEPLALQRRFLDDEGALHLDARRGMLRFNQPVQGAVSGTRLQGVAVTPAMGVTATWSGAAALRLEIDGFLDPKQEYALSLPNLRGASGHVLAVKVPLRSNAAAAVAGKTLSYKPVPGRPEPVAIGAMGEVAPLPQVNVLFDQPVTLGQARQQLRMENAAGQPIGLGLRRPPRAQWAGVRVDPRLLVQIVPRRRLDAGEEVTVFAKGPTKARTTKLTAAAPMRFTGAECSWYRDRDEICQLTKGVLRTNQRAVHLKFNHKVGLPPKRLRQQVRVTPTVRNLTVRNAGWGDGRLIVEGDFQPSTTYRLTATGLRDRFGQTQLQPVELDVEVDPLGASVTMPEGLVQLDESTSRGFPLASRNVAEAEVMLWRVAETEKSLDDLRHHLQRRTVPTGPPDVTVVVPIDHEPDALVKTEVDLRKAGVAKGQSFIATVVPKTFAYAAAPLAKPAGSGAASRPVAWLRAFDPKRLAVHAQAMADTTLVRVSRLADGTPLAGADVSLAGASAVKTDAHGVAVLDGDASDSAFGFIRVEHGAERLLWPLHEGRREEAEELFGSLVGTSGRRIDRSAFVTSDRGIYRPGETLHLKASVFEVGRTMKPLARRLFDLKVLAPDGEAVCDLRAQSTARGGVAGDCAIPADAPLGRFSLRLREGDDVIASATVRVAEYERPRFKVDVDAAADGGKLHAVVQGRYLFGGAMEGAYATWTLRREPTGVPSGPLAEEGLRFTPARSWWDEEEGTWSTSGDGRLDADGSLVVDREVPFGASSTPQRLVIEADVHDESYRHVAGRQTIVIHPAERYAGLAGPTGWVPTKSTVEAKLGVADRAGQPVQGAVVGARLERVSWRYVTRRGPGGSRSTEWKRSEQVVARCTVRSALFAQGCSLRVPRSGDYRLVAEVDGRDGGSTWFWAWGDGDTDVGPQPERGPTLPLASDQARYRAGDTAKLLVRNPYPAATAIVVRHRDGYASHHAQRIDGAAGVLELPVTTADAPALAVSVTLLPIGAEGVDAAGFKVGATSLPVALDDATLQVAVRSDRDRYEPGDGAKVTVEVTQGGEPVKDAEVMLAAVDEGVLRMTGFHALDPTSALHRPRGLANFSLLDSRSSLLALYGRSQVAGDGGSLPDLAPPRKKLVQTALWRPALTTDARGRAEVDFTLPDDLTEFRLMAVATDAAGRGGHAERGFTVSKEVLVQPILPRFASRGDRFELAAMVHNTSPSPFRGEVVVDGDATAVELAPGQRRRVAITREAQRAGTRDVRVEVRREDGTVADAVERPLRVQVPGVQRAPSLFGAFADVQEVALAIPANARFTPGAALEVKVGEHLWPELDERLEYLLDYPHGCVEQTTSSTLPLLAARHILGRIGTDPHPPSFYDERIAAGIRRLATMRTASGGLGYWPGRSEPHPYGTAYALRAVVRAEKQGVPIPAGMKQGMIDYLQDRVVDGETAAGDRVFMAESLAFAEALDLSVGDALWELRDELDAFGKASLALALGGHLVQADRVKKLLDELEGAIDDRGRLHDDVAVHHHFGASQRTEAQIALALTKLRPASIVLPLLTSHIAHAPGSYTTQTTAFGLLALADHLQGLPEAGATVAATLDGEALSVDRDLGAGGLVYRIPLARLRGQEATLRLAAQGTVGFALAARYRVPVEDDDLSSGEAGPHLYRTVTRPDGSPVDLAKVKAGETLRVALLARFDDRDARHHLALTDHLPAGFAPVDTTLDTVAGQRAAGSAHPWYEALRYRAPRPDHLELRGDRVQIYFDELRGDEVAVSYLVRATTPGTFTHPPAGAELMYEPRSHSRSDGGTVVIQ